jgi:hypothetical protein
LQLGDFQCRSQQIDSINDQVGSKESDLLDYYDIPFLYWQLGLQSNSLAIVTYDILSMSLQLGDFQSSYNAIQRSINSFNEHADSKELLKQLEKHFSILWSSTMVRRIIDLINALRLDWNTHDVVCSHSNECDIM